VEVATTAAEASEDLAEAVPEAEVPAVTFEAKM
jgi:hypothetical protein